MKYSVMPNSILCLWRDKKYSEALKMIREIDVNSILITIPDNKKMCNLAFYIGSLEGELFYYKHLKKGL